MTRSTSGLAAVAVAIAAAASMVGLRSDHATANAHLPCPDAYCRDVPAAKRDAWAAVLPPATLSAQERAAHDAEVARLAAMRRAEQQRAPVRWPEGLVPAADAGMVPSSSFMSGVHEVYVAHVGRSWITASPGTAGTEHADQGAVLLVRYDEFGEVADVAKVMADPGSGHLLFDGAGSGSVARLRSRAGARYVLDLAAWPGVVLRRVS